MPLCILYTCPTTHTSYASNVGRCQIIYLTSACHENVPPNVFTACIARSECSAVDSFTRKQLGYILAVDGDSLVSKVRRASCIINNEYGIFGAMAAYTCDKDRLNVAQLLPVRETTRLHSRIVPS